MSDTSATTYDLPEEHRLLRQTVRELAATVEAVVTDTVMSMSEEEALALLARLDPN